MLLLLLSVACRNKDTDLDTGEVTDTAPAIVDSDGDGWPADQDCDDNDASVNPDSVEVCNDLDDDCNGVVDDAAGDLWYADADGDGHGDPETSTLSCDGTGGYVADATDCDDSDAAISPIATELCDLVDNDCDGDIDEDDAADAATWSIDEDGDGFGGPDTVRSCLAASGTVDNDQDCDDTLAEVNPDADELCDGIDNNCDGAIDEDAALDAPTWSIDADGDGYGSDSYQQVQCDQDTGWVLDDSDCNDLDAALNPDTVWYADSDGDGFGDTSSTLTQCEQLSGYVLDDTDCDDTDDAVSPDGVEVCDSDDNDCDGTVDEADAVDAGTWYADSDSDGYGDASTSLVQCDQPSQYVSDDTDCDDAETAVNPGATEVCDTVDNDCDGSTDEADASDALTWYADGDGDGEGDANTSVVSCDQPSGYVSNSTDCDDNDATDTDNDGTQDCADDDIDGDGLRNDWDADEYDDTVVRGLNAGLGTDGGLTVSGSELFGDYTLMDGGAGSGDDSFDVDDASALAVGDEVLVLSQQGSDAGQWQAVFVSGISSSTLTIEPPLDAAYSSSSVVLVQRIPHYTDVSISGTLGADDWTGSGGGVVAFRATGDVSVSGTIDVNGTGFEGGSGVNGNGSDPGQGEGWSGTGSTGTTSANANGGGSYPRRGDNADSGGGGGHGSAGSAGTSYSGSSVTSGGAAAGDVDLATLLLGGGGGGGSPDTEGDGTSSSNYSGAGGDGGGLIAIWAGTSLSVTGTLDAGGQDGDDASSAGGEVGAGGAGAGGAIWLASPALTLTGSVVAEGGSGGTSAWHSGKPYGSAYGGDGGEGRVRVDYDTLNSVAWPSGDETLTEPDAGSENAWED